MRVQMLGLCRLSYSALRGYPVDRATVAERRAFLYDRDRLACRWDSFATLALPGWRAQTDGDVILVIMTGPDLPEPWLSRLRDLVAAIPQLRLELLAPMERHLMPAASPSRAMSVRLEMASAISGMTTTMPWRSTTSPRCAAISPMRRGCGGATGGCLWAMRVA